MNQSFSKLMLSAGLSLLPFAASWAQDARMDTRSLIEELGLEESGPPVRDLPGWNKPDKIYIDFSAYGEDDEEQELLASAREVAGNAEIIPVRNRLDEDTISNMEVLIGRCNTAVLESAGKLRWFQHSSHGVDDCLTPKVQKMDFIFTNAQHTSGPPMAEHAIGLMMMLSRGLHRFHLAQAGQEWIRRSIDFPVIEIKGKTMLVVGLGGIGTEVAERAHALGMRILATRNTSRTGPDFVEYVGLSDEVYDLAKQADVIVNALPLTGDTRNMFDRSLFDSVKRGAYYISIGRGETTVTADLIAAIKDGRLAAAGLDVTDPEPLPPGHELWSMPNVVITPHVAADTDQGRWRRWLTVRENLRRYVNGERMLNVVDKQLGY